MLYLILFSSLAIGFYAAVNTSVQVANNETKGKRTLLAAESGMAFIRHILSNIQIPHGTPADNMWPQMVGQIKAQLDGKAVVNYQTLQELNGVLEMNNCKIDDQGSTFTAKLINDGDQILVQVSGTANGMPLKRTIQLSYGKAQRASTIFDFGIASRSAVTLGGNAKIKGATDPTRGSVLSTTTNAVPLNMSGQASISGDFSWANAGSPTFGSNIKIADLRTTDFGFSDHLHAPSDVIAPEFPTIDSSIFEKYVPTKTAPPGPQVIATTPPSSRLSYTNIRIKANAGGAGELTFPAGSVLSGVIFVETPNKITFSGGVTIKGVIVQENNPTGTIATNTMWFGGNVTHEGVQSLPDSFGDLKKLTGSALLLPSFKVTLRGTANVIGGTIVTGALDVSSTAGANIKGSIINLQDSAVTLNGGADIIITSTGTSDYPAGVYFGTHYVPLPDTYKEIAQ